MQANRSRDLTGTTFQLLALAALIVTSFWIARPFLMALAWATMIAVATWPLLLHAQAWLGGRRALAVTVMTMALLLVLVVPLYFGITAIVENAKRIAASHPDLGERFLSCEGTAPFASPRTRPTPRVSSTCSTGRPT
jgi:predicted PurR-regulated permease PerM